MKPPAIFETERLRLRPPVLEDAAAIFETYGQDPEVTRYLSWRPHQGIGDAREFLEACLAGWQHDGPFNWLLTAREDGRLLGSLELRPQGARVELGYVLARAHWGQGLMTEAVRAVTEWALTQPGIYRVWAVCDVENGASARVLQKAGMAREGVLRRWAVFPNLGATARDVWCFARVKPSEAPH